MALTVLDASVVIAILDPDDALHASAKEAITKSASDDLVLPASGLAETLVVPARAGRLDEVRAAIDALELTIAELGEREAIRAAELRAQHPGLRLPDALIIATADAMRAEALLTGDARWKQISPAVRVLKP